MHDYSLKKLKNMIIINLKLCLKALLHSMQPGQICITPSVRAEVANFL